jgi:hypothetical protein
VKRKTYREIEKEREIYVPWDTDRPLSHALIIIIIVTATVLKLCLQCLRDARGRECHTRGLCF